MAELMFVTPRLQGAKPGGREFLSRLHYDCLKDLYGDRLCLFELQRTPLAGLGSQSRALRGYIDGVTPQSIAELVDKARSEQTSAIFFNGSNLGLLARAVKKHLPSVTLFTFFHNVEARFFFGSFRRSRSVRALSVAFANFIAERAAVRFSDRRIAMSGRDSALLRRYYGRTSTDLLPMALDDKLPPGSDSGPAPAVPDYLLFVGGAFYANEAGIIWFADKVVPHIQAKIVVVGQGMEQLRPLLERAGNVEVVGAVDDLAPWYLEAAAVIAPIFDGSGMKTKTAEALMFGKRVIGTSESFSGYEDIAAQAGWLCNDVDEFISAIGEAQALPRQRVDPILRQIYERRYSREAIRRRLAEILSFPKSELKPSIMPDGHFAQDKGLPS